MSPLCLAIAKKYDEIAEILEEQGAKCTKEEKRLLGENFTNFCEQLSVKKENRIKDKDNCIEHKDKRIQDKDEIIENQKSLILTFEQQAKRRGEKIVQLNQEIHLAKKQKEIEQQIQVQLWKGKMRVAQQIKSCEDLQFLSTLAHGCDGIVFNCSAPGIQSVALKIIFNLGIPTTEVERSFDREYNILKSLPLHVNIIPIWKDFRGRPTEQFIQHFPEPIKEQVVHRTGEVRTTTLILVPIFECFQKFCKEEFANLTVSVKLSFISDILSGLLFLFENDVMHNDMKLDNLLITSSGRIIISDFGWATKVTPNKTLEVGPGNPIGGNAAHKAPEIKRVTGTFLKSGTRQVDFSKQPSFELGVLAFEIFFTGLPDVYGEEMNDDYFKRHCSVDSHKISEIFKWMRGLLMEDPKQRTSLPDAAETFKHLQTKL